MISTTRVASPKTMRADSFIGGGIDGSRDHLSLNFDDPASPPIIPPAHPARTLVLCFDGTGDQFDADNSNVVQFFSLLKKDDRSQQMVYYQAGIGTYIPAQFATPFVTGVSKTLDEMIALHLDSHVMSGYEFLMQNYEAGDKICLFGFSRGAYTARALAGMIHKVGLLPACNQQQVPFAYRMYSRTDEIGWAQSTAFKKAFSMDVDIEFIGVWDTVSSVGMIPKRLPFTTSNTAVKTFRHAISLDERRARFLPNIYNRPTAEEAHLGTQHGEMPKSTVAALAWQYGVEIDDTDSEKRTPRQLEQAEHEHRFSIMEKGPVQTETDVLEVWFAGCHCDVGGGSVPNNTRHSLARIPLRWMIRQCFLRNTGIRFHTDLLRTVGLDPATLYPEVLPRPPPVHRWTSIERRSPKFTGRNTTRSSFASVHAYEDPGKPIHHSMGYAGINRRDMHLSEEEEDLADAVSPIYDQLALRWGWWALELLPMRRRVQDNDGQWTEQITMNLGRGRTVPDGKNHKTFHVHRTVKLRMEADELEGGRYEPKAEFTIEPTWVD